MNNDDWDILTIEEKLRRMSTAAISNQQKQLYADALNRIIHLGEIVDNCTKLRERIDGDAGRIAFFKNELDRMSDALDWIESINITEHRSPATALCVVRDLAVWALNGPPATDPR